MAVEGVAEGWTVWDHEPDDRLILVFRPDIFDGDAFPAACLPTIYVREGERDLRLLSPDPAPGTEDTWRVQLFLEPAVGETFGTFDSWDDAVDGAVDVAGRFCAGELDLHGMYLDPREAYLARLDALLDQD